MLAEALPSQVWWAAATGNAGAAQVEVGTVAVAAAQQDRATLPGHAGRSCPYLGMQKLPVSVLLMRASLKVAGSLNE